MSQRPVGIRQPAAPKPHLFMFCDLWHCVSPDHIYTARTPYEAYAGWAWAL